LYRSANPALLLLLLPPPLLLLLRVLLVVWVDAGVQRFEGAPCVLIDEK